MRSLHPLVGAVLFVGLGLSGCRGWTSDQPPVHLNPNMDTQQKHKAYRADDFFADGRSMRTPPEGTVARTLSGDASRDADYLRADEAYYYGTADGKTMSGLPERLEVTPELLERGRQRYDIYCAPCHARHGTGAGTVASRLKIKPPNFHDDGRRAMSVSHFFRIITHGKPLPEDRADPSIPLNMPSYAAQIPTDDRWAVALYVRALQQSQYAGGAIPTDGLGAAAPAEAAPADGAPAEAAPADGAPADGAPVEAAPAATPETSEPAAQPKAGDGSTP